VIITFIPINSALYLSIDINRLKGIDTKLRQCGLGGFPHEQLPFGCYVYQDLLIASTYRYDQLLGATALGGFPDLKQVALSQFGLLPSN